MHPRLVTCLLGSTLISVAAAILAFSAGGGVIAAVFAMSFTGSTTLLTSSLLAAWIDERRPRRALATARGTAPA